MKKTFMLFVSVVVLLFFSTSFSVEGTVADLGKFAPSFKMENGDIPSTIENYRGQYLLLTFWSSEDGRSRLNCNEYDSFFTNVAHAEGENSRIAFVAVNFDKNKPLFEELVRYDNLNATSQFYVSENEIKQISKAYNLNNGLKSYLIDPSGRIVSVNPDKKKLAEIMTN